MKAFLYPARLALLMGVAMSTASAVSMRDYRDTVLPDSNFLVRPASSSSPFGLKAGVRQATGGIPSFKLGQNVSFAFRINRSAYTYLFVVNPHNQAEILIPNRSQYAQGQIMTLAGERRFPAVLDDVAYRPSRPFGRYRMLVIATSSPLPGTVYDGGNREDGFIRLPSPSAAKLQLSLAQALSKMPRGSWESAGAQFDLVSAASAPSSTSSIPSSNQVSAKGVFSNGGRDWRVSFKTSRNIQDVRMRYEGQLLSQPGTRLDSRSQSGSTLVTRMTRSYLVQNKPAVEHITLSVRPDGAGQVAVSIIRR